jgi:hypothetical protein
MTIRTESQVESLTTQKVWKARVMLAVMKLCKPSFSANRARSDTFPMVSQELRLDSHFCTLVD